MGVRVNFLYMIEVHFWLKIGHGIRKRFSTLNNEICNRLGFCFLVSMLFDTYIHEVDVNFKNVTAFKYASNIKLTVS